PRYLPGDWPGYWPIIQPSSQEALDGLYGLVERAAVGVGKRCRAHPACPVGGVRTAFETLRRGQQARELALASIVGARGALPKPPRLQQLDAERDIASRGLASLVEPGLEVRLLATMAQRAAPQALEAGQ